MIMMNHAKSFRFRWRTDKEDFFFCNLSSEMLLSFVEEAGEAVIINIDESIKFTG